MSAIAGERLVFGQQNGGQLELRVHGDEFYARYETPGGYTVVYDLDRGQYCYAALRYGRFVSSGTPVSKPAPWGLRRHLRENPDVRNEKFGRRYGVLRPAEESLGASADVMYAVGPNSGLLGGRQVPRGKVRGLTVLVEFADLRSSVTQADVAELLNDPSSAKHGNACSVRKFYETVSSGKLIFTNKVVGPVKLSRKQSYYINRPLMREALQLAVDQCDIDFSEFDSLDQGYIDALSFMYAGRSLYQGYLWPHNSTANLPAGQYRTHFYTVQSLGRHRIDLSIGTFAHEAGHMLCRFPDLYDYGERDGDSEQSSGLGQYCLMSWGNHNNRGKTPSPVCAYLRDLAGWCDNVVDLSNPGVYQAKHGDYRTLYRYGTDKANEYFLVENRHRQGLDRHLPDTGLAVYHCDTRGSNEYQDGTPDDHYQCALIQADGKFDLEKTTKGGDAGDLYESRPEVALSDDTVPNSNEWDRTDSGLILSEIGASGPAISFRAGKDAAAEVVKGRSTPDLIIPDHDPAGVTDSIRIDKDGTVSAISASVRISHTYRGDLEVILTAPSGKSVTLHKDEGGSLDNLALDLSTADFPALASLTDESIRGDWELRVCDHLRDDMGRLDSWDLRIQYQAAADPCAGEATPGETIPDSSISGLRSTIPISGSGTVKAISVEVSITHPFRGDIKLELIAPSGERALLRESLWDSGTDIQETYTEESIPSLRSLIGEQCQGDWTLLARDLGIADTGTLDRWALAIQR